MSRRATRTFFFYIKIYWRKNSCLINFFKQKKDNWNKSCWLYASLICFAFYAELFCLILKSYIKLWFLEKFRCRQFYLSECLTTNTEDDSFLSSAYSPRKQAFSPWLQRKYDFPGVLLYEMIKKFEFSVQPAFCKVSFFEILELNSFCRNFWLTLF